MVLLVQTQLELAQVAVVAVVRQAVTLHQVTLEKLAVLVVTVLQALFIFTGKEINNG
jgi:hypothetical protein